MKTLKDMVIRFRGARRPDTEQTDFYNIIIIGEYADIVWPNQFRQSAIEDLREEMERFKKADTETKSAMAAARLDYIKEKFNLTEEDLK